MTVEDHRSAGLFVVVGFIEINSSPFPPAEGLGVFMQDHTDSSLFGFPDRTSQNRWIFIYKYSIILFLYSLFLYTWLRPLLHTFPPTHFASESPQIAIFCHFIVSPFCKCSLTTYFHLISISSSTHTPQGPFQAPPLCTLPS